jgi:hypothetical protein
MLDYSDRRLATVIRQDFFPQLTLRSNWRYSQKSKVEFWERARNATQYVNFTLFLLFLYLLFLIFIIRLLLIHLRFSLSPYAFSPVPLRLLPVLIFPPRHHGFSFNLNRSTFFFGAAADSNSQCLICRSLSSAVASKNMQPRLFTAHFSSWRQVHRSIVLSPPCALHPPYLFY